MHWHCLIIALWCGSFLTMSSEYFCLLCQTLFLSQQIVYRALYHILFFSLSFLLVNNICATTSPSEAKLRRTQMRVFNVPYTLFYHFCMDFCPVWLNSRNATACLIFYLVVLCFSTMVLLLASPGHRKLLILSPLFCLFVLGHFTPISFHALNTSSGMPFEPGGLFFDGSFWLLSVLHVIIFLVLECHDLLLRISGLSWC